MAKADLRVKAVQALEALGLQRVQLGEGYKGRVWTASAFYQGVSHSITAVDVRSAAVNLAAKFGKTLNPGWDHA